MATSGHWRSGAPSCVFKILASAISLAFGVFISSSFFLTCWSHSAEPPPLNENRTLWKLGTLQPGLVTFYATTKPLYEPWHVLGCGYNPSISMDEIQNATVVSF